jgi:hypothetical protein
MAGKSLESRANHPRTRFIAGIAGNIWAAAS